jgi:hypothetical protein
MRLDLHDAAGHARLRGQRRRQRLVGLELQHGAGGAGQQRGGAVQRDHLAGLEHRDAVAQRLGLFQVVRGQQHRVALAVQARDELPQGLAQLHVHAGGGLVQHDHRRAVHQRLRHQHAPLHAARELAHVGVGLVGQAQVGEQLVDPVVVAPDAEIAGLDAQRLAHREERVEHQLLRHDAELPAGLGVLRDDVVAVHAHLPARGMGQAGEDADQGGLACAVGAQQAEEFARFDLEADVFQRLQHPTCALVQLGNVLEADGGHEERNCRQPPANLLAGGCSAVPAPGAFC